MKIKVSEAEGIALDWMVAKAEGFAIYHDAVLNGDMKEGFWLSGYFPMNPNMWIQLSGYSPSTRWPQCGPIIEREGIELGKTYDGWAAKLDLDEGDAMIETQYGPTPLIAAMRCYVASKLGEEVDVPEEQL